MSGFLGVLAALQSYVNITFTAWNTTYQRAAGSTASASITLNSDGTVTRSGTLNFAGSDGAQWTATQTGVGSQVWVKLTVTSGVAPGTGTAGSVLSLSAGQTWSHGASISDARTDYTLDFYGDAAGTALLKTVTGNVLFREHV